VWLRHPDIDNLTWKSACFVHVSQTQRNVEEVMKLTPGMLCRIKSYTTIWRRILNNDEFFGDHDVTNRIIETATKNSPRVVLILATGMRCKDGAGFNWTLCALDCSKIGWIYDVRLIPLKEK
jgi:hypothetical protein